MSEIKNNNSAKARGIYLLPNLFTTAALFSGFYAVVASMNGRFESAAIAVFIAMIFDGLDGRIARMTGTESSFGVQYDSLSDMISFGIAPSLVSYNWALHDLGKIGWLAAFIFAVSAALRLARFNTQVGKADKHYFQGLASPSAAGIVAGMVWLGQNFGWDPEQLHSLRYVAAILTVCAGLLMVSNFRYYSFKGIDLKGKVPFVVVLLIVLVIVVVALRPALVLFCVFTIYAISGPVYTIRTVRKLKMKHVVGEDDDSDDEPDSELGSKETTQEATNATDTDIENTDEKKS